MLRVLHILIFLGIIGQISAQNPILDSLKSATTGNPKTFLGFHNRNTFINTNTVKLNGLVLGLDFNEKVKYHIGYYWLQNADTKLLIKDNRFPFDTIRKNIGIYNFSLGVEYSFKQTNRWNLMAPVQIGMGNLHTKYRYQDSLLLHEKGFILPIESGVNAYFSILDWLVFKSGVGYRLSIGNKEAFKLSAPYYSIGVSVKLGVLYQDVKDIMAEL